MQKIWLHGVFVLIVRYLLSAVYSTHNSGKIGRYNPCVAMEDNNKAYLLPTIEIYKVRPIKQTNFVVTGPY